MKKVIIAGPFSNVTFSKQLAVCFLMFGLVLAQAIGVIYIKQNKRMLHSNLQNMYKMRDKLHIEWSQLLLEQGTWEADARVEHIARDRLGMVMPDKVNLIAL